MGDPAVGEESSEHGFFLTWVQVGFVDEHLGKPFPPESLSEVFDGTYGGICDLGHLLFTERGGEYTGLCEVTAQGHVFLVVLLKELLRRLDNQEAVSIRDTAGHICGKPRLTPSRRKDYKGRCRVFHTEILYREPHGPFLILPQCRHKTDGELVFFEVVDNKGKDVLGVTDILEVDTEEAFLSVRRLFGEETVNQDLPALDIHGEDGTVFGTALAVDDDMDDAAAHDGGGIDLLVVGNVLQGILVLIEAECDFSLVFQQVMKIFIGLLFEGINLFTGLIDMIQDRFHERELLGCF